MRTCTTAAIFALVLGLPALASATPFTATYTFTGSPGNQVSEPIDSQPLGASFADITRGPGVTAFAGANSINSVAWTTGSTIDPNDYYQFVVTPQPDFAVDLTQLDFSERRSAQGILTFDIRSSLDAYATSLFMVTLPDDTLTRRFTVPLGAAFDDLTTPVTFRLFGYGSQSGSGTWRLGVAPSPDNPSGFPANFQVFGDARVVPEPTSLTMLSLAFAVSGVRRWRTRKSCGHIDRLRRAHTC